MPEVIQFPLVEAFAVSYLKTQLAARGKSWRVATDVPNPAPDQYVRVSRTGGVQVNVITDSPMLLVECYGQSTAEAAKMASLCRALLLAAARETDTVDRVQDAGGPVSLPDPDTNLPRYQFSVQLNLRGASI